MLLSHFIQDNEKLSALMLYLFIGKTGAITVHRNIRNGHFFQDKFEPICLTNVRHDFS